jgi:hypothetical protein
VWFECCSILRDFIELLCIKQACGWNRVDLSLSPVWYRQTKLTGSIFICRWHWHFNFTWYCVNNTGSRLRQCSELSLVMLHAPLLQHFHTTYIFAHLVAVLMHDEYIVPERLWLSGVTFEVFYKTDVNLNLFLLPTWWKIPLFCNIGI